MSTTRHINPTYLSGGVNNYVPKMTMASDVFRDDTYQFDAGSPATLDADGILDGVAADDSGPYTYTIDDFRVASEVIPGMDTAGYLDAPFGRDITAVGSGVGVTQDLTILFEDYLGQRITKTKALNGATPIKFGIAVKRLISVTVAVGASSETIDVGFSDDLGLPYKTVAIVQTLVDGVVDSAATFTTPVLTDPATTSTGDPRGLVNPNLACNGSRHFVFTCRSSDWRNGDSNGGLHGIKQT